MAQFILNPRRAPRAPARCQVAVIAAATSFDAETEDIGSRGCQLVAPARLTKGERLDLAVSNDRIPDHLRIPGTVAWVSPREPWRLGIAFEEALLAVSGRWFERLVAAHPGLGSFRRVPDRIAADAMVYLGPPPRYLLDFTREEAALLRAIGSGIRADELRTRMRAEWSSAERALFSLIARQAVTLSRGQAAHPAAWRKILADVEAAIAVESLSGAPPEARAADARPGSSTGSTPAGTPAPPPGAGGARAAATPVPWGWASTPVPGAPAVAPWGAASADARPLLDLEPGDGAPLDLDGPATSPRRPEDPAGWRGHASAQGGAGVGWRRPARPRSAEAQAAFDRARAELAQGSVSGALSLLRRALALAPGDAEIADALGKLAFQGRTPGAR